MAGREISTTTGSSAAASSSVARTRNLQRRGRQNKDAARSTAAVGAPLNERARLQISLLRNARYNEDRERFFARIHKGAMFVVVMGGSSLFADYSQVWIAAAVITLAGTLDLVFDVSGRARLHASLRRRIYDILAQLEDPKREVSKLNEMAVQVFADEPPCMHAVNALAFNGAMAAAGRPHDLQFKLRWHQRFFRHWFAFQSTKFETLREIAEAKVLSGR